MYWIICLSILTCLVVLFTYTRMIAYKIKTFHIAYKQELESFEKHSNRELFDWDEVSKRRSNELGGDIPRPRIQSARRAGD
jgi:hypothetical protein